MSALTPMTSGATRRRGRRLLWAVLAATLFTALVGGTGAAASAYHRQQDDLAAARADRAAAAAALDSAVAHAEADGVTTAQLAAVLTGQRQVLGQAAVAPRYLWFDNGEVGRQRAAAATLRELAGRVAVIQSAATDGDRDAAADELTDLDTALAQARDAGVDVTGEAALAEAVHNTVSGAGAPRLVDEALSSVPALVSRLQQRTEDKLAADRRAAEAAYSQAHDGAVAAVQHAQALLLQAQAFAALQLDALAPPVQALQAALDAATTVDALNGVAAAARSAGYPLASLLSARSTAYAAIASARQIVADAIGFKIDPGTIPAQLDALQTQLDGTGTTAAFRALSAQVAALIGPLADRVGIAELGVGKVIVISLQRQELTAYQDGVPYLTTLVTTGRPALPTPPGHYVIYRKNSPYIMHSDWPPSSPYWYPDSWMQYAMWFLAGGYAIHDAPWRTVYGPGTQATGSHGCVNTPRPAMDRLYAWADVGTRVIIH